MRPPRNLARCLLHTHARGVRRLLILAAGSLALPPRLAIADEPARVVGAGDYTITLEHLEARVKELKRSIAMSGRTRRCILYPEMLGIEVRFALSFTIHSHLTGLRLVGARVAVDGEWSDAPLASPVTASVERSITLREHVVCVHAWLQGDRSALVSYPETYRVDVTTCHTVSAARGSSGEPGPSVADVSVFDRGPLSSMLERPGVTWLLQESADVGASQGIAPASAALPD